MVGVDACICELRVDARVEREEGDVQESPWGSHVGTCTLRLFVKKTVQFSKAKHNALCAYLYVRAEYSRDSSLYGPAAAPQSATGIRVHVRGVMR